MPKPTEKTSEDRRYTAYRWGAHAAWWTAFAWTCVLTYINITRPAMAVPNTFQRISGLFIILLMGVAIALGSALSRMRLSRTITQVLEVGVTVGQAGSQERQRQIIDLLEQELDSKKRRA